MTVKNQQPILQDTRKCAFICAQYVITQKNPFSAPNNIIQNVMMKLQNTAAP